MIKVTANEEDERTGSEGARVTIGVRGRETIGAGGAVHVTTVQVN